MMKSCVYCIINLKNNKRYIGSAIDIDNRIRGHLRLLRKNQHHSKYLQRSYNKHGKDSFIFHIIEWCPPEKTREYEQIYLDNLKPEYNVSKNSTAPMDGRKHSKKTIEKYKERIPWNVGIPRTEDEKSRMSDTWKKIHSEKTPEERKAATIQLDKYRELHGAAFKGKRHTEENKKIFRDKHKSKKRIECVNTGEIFEAQIDIQRKYGFKQGHVSEVLNGKRANIKGYKFKYEGEPIPEYHSTLQAVEDNFGNKFKTITDCCKYHNLDRIKVNNKFKNRQEIEICDIVIKRIISYV